MIHNGKSNDGAKTPAWIVTFADLMTLLMCFFVLLFSFAEIDAQKFKEVSASLRAVFGSEGNLIEPVSANAIDLPSLNLSPQAEVPTAVFDTKVTAPTENLYDIAAELLKDEIANEVLKIDTSADGVIISGDVQLIFSPASDQVNGAFLPQLEKISRIIEVTPARVIVAGHTDNRPIYGTRYRSNWELSTARAVSIIHHLLENPRITKDRFIAQGYADTQPIASNETEEGRAQNRRVEILIEVPSAVIEQGLKEISPHATETSN